jgi:hypothetical protein
MNEQQARKLIEQSSKITEKIFREYGELQAPIIHFKGDYGETAITAPTENRYEKDVAATAIRHILKNDNAEWVLLIAEAWMVALPLGQDLDTSPEDSISGHPDRVEVITYQLEDQDLGVMSAKQDIVRIDGQRPYLSELRWDARPTESSGRLVGLLPRKGRLS